jgi:hypothetical protein
LKYLTHILIFSALLACLPARSQRDCSVFFDEYPNQLKAWSKKTIDSLKDAGVDTIVFYGVGWPNTGALGYAKVIWVSGAAVNTVEINFAKRDMNESRLAKPKYTWNASAEPISFYSKYSMDTVTTSPRELTWMSHDWIHFVYSSIAGKTQCFTAEEYLLRDHQHLRSRWIGVLSGYIYPHELCKVIDE